MILTMVVTRMFWIAIGPLCAHLFWMEEGPILHMVETKKLPLAFFCWIGHRHEDSYH